MVVAAIAEITGRDRCYLLFRDPDYSCKFVFVLFRDMTFERVCNADGDRLSASVTCAGELRMYRELERGQSRLIMFEWRELSARFVCANVQQSVCQRGICHTGKHQHQWNQYLFHRTKATSGSYKIKNNREAL